MASGPATGRHPKAYGEAAPPGCMGGMLNMLDWNNALLGGKKFFTDLDFLAGLEAPRNSLDIVSGGSRTSDTPKCSSVAKADIPFGYEIKKPVIAAKEYSKSKRLRNPSVVARLMGLDALPDAESAATMSEIQSLHVKNQKQRLLVAQKLLKDIKVRPQLNDHVRTLVLKRAGKAVPKNVHRGDVDQCNQKYPCGAPGREEHPQERQLQEFKKQFASKLALNQSESVNREVQVKRVMVQAKMNKVEAVLAGGEKNDPKRLTAALKNLNKSKEYREVLEVLQSNEEFFLKLLQDPNSVLMDKRLQVPEEGTHTSPRPIEARTGKGVSESTGKSSEKKTTGGISPSSFAQRFMELRRERKERKEKWKSQEQGSKSLTETEENTPISTPRTSTSLLPRFRGRSKSKSVEVEKDLTVPATTISKEESFSVDSYTVDPFSVGSIILLKPGSTDNTGINSPFSALSYSLRLSRSGNESTSKGRKITEGASEYQYEHGDMTPRSEKSSLGDWDYAFPSEGITRDSREGAQHRGKCEKYESLRSKEPRDIARAIIREARASARYFTKFEHSTVGEARFSTTERASTSVAHLRMGRDRGDVCGSSEGEMTPCSTGRLETSSRDYHDSSHSGMNGISSPVAAHVNPRPSQDIANFSQISVDQRQKAPRKSAPDFNKNHQSNSHPSRSPSTCQISSEVLTKSIVSSLQKNRILASKDVQQDDRVSLMPLHLRGESMPSTIQTEADIAANSPRTLSSSLSLHRCRSLPSAPLVRGTRSRGKQPINTDGGAAGTSSPAQPESVASVGKQFADSYERGVEAVGSLFARAKSKERNKIFVRIRKKQAPAANEPTNLPSSKGTGQESMSVSCSSSHVSCLVATSEDFTGTEFNVSNASPFDWGGVLATNDNEPEAEETERIPFVNDATVSTEREQPDLLQVRVEPQLSKAPSELTRFTRQVRVNGDMATDRSKSITDSLSIIESLQVSAGEQLSRTFKISSIATDTPRKQKDEVLEMAVDKGGHPSPLSVLESPFQEDRPSPAEFKAIASDLQELRLHLHLLKLDGNDRSRPSLVGTQKSSNDETQGVHKMFVDRDPDNFKESTDCQFSCAVHSSKTSTSTAAEVQVFSPVASDVYHCQRTWLESIDLEGFSHAQERKEDLVYVRDLLVASEFVESSTKVFARWYSPNHPLDPILFENLEEYYKHGICTPQVLIVNGQMRSGRADAQPRHRMLFDAVNEVLLRKLGPYLTFHPWVQPSTLLLRPIPVGRVLVLETWMELCDFFPSCRADASSFLLDRDLGTGLELAGFREKYEEFGLELEKTIFDDLIYEAVQSLIQIKHQ